LPNQRDSEKKMLQLWLPQDLLEQFDIMYPKRGSRTIWITRAMRAHVDSCGSPAVQRLIAENKRQWEERRVLQAVQKRSLRIQQEAEDERKLAQRIANYQANKGGN